MSPKNLVLLVAVTRVVCSVAMITLNVSLTGTGKLPVELIQLVLTCLLSYSLIRRWKPGRWIAVVLMGISGLGCFLGAAVAFESVGAPALILVVLGLVYLLCVGALLSPVGAAHFNRRPRVLSSS